LYAPYINRIVISWDIAFRANKTNDYSVGITFVELSDGRIYIVDLVREKLEMPSLLKRIKSYNREINERFAESFGSEAMNVVEAVGGGIGLVQMLKKECGVICKRGYPDNR
jgi:phage terminase large subunit-like protein